MERRCRSDGPPIARFRSKIATCRANMPRSSRPSAAIGVLRPDGTAFLNVEVRRHDQNDTSELRISRTVLDEVVKEKKALAFVDISADEKLKRAQSIVMQGIRSIVCAPLVIGDAVV